ncbi:MAG TPA: hypothetical protein VNV82_17860 [Bryobacteraceae bacterium]|jgi:4,5-dihydroxyphthalate decarboxylase|nr:hypothetical protein [Bryobacteraceae bacterium]
MNRRNQPLISIGRVELPVQCFVDTIDPPPTSSALFLASLDVPSRGGFMTAPVWIRGILSDEYGVPITSAIYLSGGEEEPGRDEKIALSLAPEIRVEAIPRTKTLSRMIESGEIDALYTARAPSTFHSGDGSVRRLFPDYLTVEQNYYKKTGIFPIMHVIAIRRAVYEKNP